MPSDLLPLADSNHVVVVGGPTGYAVDIATSGHRLRADEPAAAGGEDSGPNPYDLLLAALGACKVMTLRMYADRKEWPLEGIRIDLSHSRVHAQDCAECETEKGLIDQIDTRLELEGPLSDEQRDRLLQIANKCPVHRTLMTETRFVSDADAG